MERAVRNGHSRDAINIGHTRRSQTKQKTDHTFFFK